MCLTYGVCNVFPTTPTILNFWVTKCFHEAFNSNCCFGTNRSLSPPINHLQSTVHNNFMLKDAINTFYTYVKINGNHYGQLHLLILTWDGRLYTNACLPFFHNAFNEPHKVYITFILIQQWSFPLPLKYYRYEDGVLRSTSLNFEIEIPTSNPSLPSHLVET